MRGLGPSLLEINAFEQLRCFLRIERLLEDHLVFFFHVTRRMRDGLGQIAVVGQKKQPFAFRVEAADMRKVRHVGREQIVERGFAALRLPRGNDTRRFVQQDMTRARGADHPSAGHDRIPRLDNVGQFANGTSVDAHAAAEDDLLARAARSEPAQREIPVETHGFAHSKTGGRSRLRWEKLSPFAPITRPAWFFSGRSRSGRL